MNEKRKPTEPAHTPSPPVEAVEKAILLLVEWLLEKQPHVPGARENRPNEQA
ncbi:MAG: hypothetical protein K8I30_24145 [Anaerolineae bacterium]|nr:hypothetical protein [Anaerolineae bacterium]